MKKAILLFVLAVMLCPGTDHAAGLPYTVNGNNFAAGTVDGLIQDQSGLALGKNQLVNASFESGLTGWSGVGSWSAVADVFHAGAGSAKFTTASAGDAFADYTGSTLSCKGGDVFYFSAWVKTLGVAGYPSFRPVYWNSSNVYLGEASLVSKQVTGTSDWTLIEASVTVPANTAKIWMRINVSGLTGTVWWDDVYCENRSSPTYSSSGSFVSAAIDCETKTTFGRLAWSSAVPPGCTITIKTRSSDDGAIWNPVLWSAAPSYALSDTDILSPAGRFIQVRAEFTTSDSFTSPSLSEIKIGPAMQDFNAGAFKFKSSDIMQVDISFNVDMDSTAGCTVVLVDSKNGTFRVNRPGEGSWTDIRHFRTKAYTVPGTVAGGFARLNIYGGKTGAGVDLYGISYPLVLMDMAEIAPDRMEFFPDPFSPNGDGRADQAQLMLSFSSQVNLTARIYNLKGAPVRVLADNLVVSGNTSVIWDGADDLGKPCPVGLYVFQVKTDSWVKTGTVVLTK